MKYFIFLFFVNQAKGAIVFPLTDEQLRASPVAVTGTFTPAPASGAATSALQVTGNSFLSSIDSKLTAPIAVSGTFNTSITFPSSQTVNQGTNPWLTSGSVTVVNSSIPVTGTFFQSVQTVSTTGINAVSGFVTVSNPQTSVSITGIPTVSFTNTSIGVTQSSSPWITSGTVAIVNSSLPVTIAATVAVSTTGINQVSGSVTVNNPVTSLAVNNFPAFAGLTDAQIRATPLAVSTTGTIPVSLLSVPIHGVTQSGTWNVGLNTGSNAIGSITNTGFNVTGTLPAYAATPTFNVGTISTIATEATVSAFNSKIPTGLTISGTRLLVELPASGGGGLTNTELRATPVPVYVSSTAILGSVAVTGTFFQANQPVSTTGTNIISGSVTVNNPVTSVSIAGSVVTSTTGTVTANAGANLNTSALNLETTQSAINTKIPSNLTVSGTRLLVELPAGGGGLTNTELRASAVPVSIASVLSVSTTGTNIVSGFITVNNPVTSVNINGTVPVSTTGVNSVSGFITVSNQLSGFATSALQTSGNASLTSIDTKLTAPLTITGALTDTQLRASAVPVSTTGIASVSGFITVSNQISGFSTESTLNSLNSKVTAVNTNAVSITGSVLPSGAATSVLQSTQDASINSLLKPASTLAAVTTVGAVTSITNALPTGTNSIGQITANAGTNLNTSALNLETTQSALNAKIPSQITGRIPVQTFPVADDLIVTAVGATGVAVTATLPAVASQFHYIDSIEITLYSTAARTGVATPITCTTTNLNGSPAYTWATAAVIGAADTRQLHNANRPIKSSVVNTATTIVCPVVTGGIWRINVVYSAGL